MNKNTKSYINEMRKERFGWWVGSDYWFLNKGKTTYCVVVTNPILLSLPCPKKKIQPTIQPTNHLIPKQKLIN